MNFWTWLDRNGHGLAIFLLILACIVTPAAAELVTGRPHEGCSVRCEPSK